MVRFLLGRLREYDAASLRHSFRVARLAGALGRALDLPAREARHLRWGALLHDIGKLFVPRDVLNKPAPLTSQERVWVDLHGQEGSALLSGYAALPPVVAGIARHHHDAWHDAGPGVWHADGAAGSRAPGPSQLVGIVTVADVYDALVSERPYKPAWSAPEAMRELHRQAGHRLAPHLVAAFEEMLEREGPRSGGQETC